ncbi:MAG TPA: hypothetical protein VHY35_05220 [Stellaceae bacterium]|jgi:hypothetical protein|nr:hypothetical protein [Stellaceae bacterium]
MSGATIELQALLSRDGVLRCPNCGGEYLHEKRVEVFHRSQEDGPWYGITIENGTALADCSAPNPSYRRDGLLIFFECELCALETADIPLAVYQHKGRTFIEWRPFAPVVQA